MGAEGDLQKIEHQTLPPRKRAGWTGGDDRGPSSKPKDKSAQSPAEGEENAAVSAAAAADGGGAAVVGSAVVGAASTSAVELAVAVGAESASAGELPVAVGAESTSVGSAGDVESVKSGGDGVGVGGASAIEDVEMGGDGVSVGGERRPEGATNNQAEDHPVETASNEGGGRGTIESNGDEQAGKSEEGLKGGDGVVDMVGRKQTAPDAGLGVDAKRAKSNEGGGGGNIESNGGEQVGKSEDGLKGGDGSVDVVGGKRTAPDADLGVGAKCAKTADGDATV